MLIDRQKAALLVVDFQDRLLPKITGLDALLANAIRLIRCARELDMPILWTEQYPQGLGPTTTAIAAELQALTPFEKTAFGCLGDQKFTNALDALGREQLLVTGIEAHVCVLQTALMAHDKGYTVFVARDAVSSRRELDRDAGLARMERAGVHLVTVEMAIFEALREAGTPEFKRILPLLK